MKNDIELCYHDKVIDEIVEMLKTNLLIQYNHNKDSLINLRDYCKDKENDKYDYLPYQQLLFFTEEALADLINTPFLYDFRPLD
jgi:hypothetical protein